MEHLLSTHDLTRAEVESLFYDANEFLPVAVNKGKCLDILEGKILASLFYEPSTRTRLSTEAAMLRLGGKVITATGVENSSLKKGETLYDTAQMVSRYADIVAIRHPQAGAAKEIAKGSSVPVINCGDGANDHPTQALLDTFTIFKHYGRLDNLTVALVGDLQFSRTSHGLLALLSKFNNNKIVLCSPKELPLGQEYYYENLEFEVKDDIQKAISGADVLYSSRVQKERFSDLDQYEKLKDYFVFTLDLLKNYAPESILLHALPRVDEIKVEVDDWKGAKYFDAVTNGVAVRMSILKNLLT